MTDRLFVLAMDQRPWLTNALYGHTGTPTPEQRAIICDGKHLVLEGLLGALPAARPEVAAAAAVLVDEQLGAGVAERARAHHVTVSMPVERGGCEVYETEPDDLAAFVCHHAPEYTKVLVRYNPDGDPQANALQRSRLAEVSKVARDAGSRFLFELLVPPTPAQLAEVDGDQDRYAGQARGPLALAAMEEIARDVEVDVWKLEHLGRPEDYVAAAQLAAGHDATCILLGANAPLDTVKGWLRDAATSGFAGFAIGRSIWWDALRGYLDGAVDRAAASAAVGARYVELAETFLEAGGA